MLFNVTIAIMLTIVTLIVGVVTTRTSYREIPTGPMRRYAMATFNWVESSEAFRTVLDQIGMVAPVESAARVQEETGIDKEGIAQVIHQASPSEPGVTGSAQRTANLSDLRLASRAIEQEWCDRLCRLEQWISELLIKNEQLRMSLRLAGRADQEHQDGWHVKSY
jgi:hypothetical protein